MNIEKKKVPNLAMQIVKVTKMSDIPSETSVSP